MPLTLRPTGLGSGIDKDRPDYTRHIGRPEVHRLATKDEIEKELTAFLTQIGGRLQPFQRPDLDRGG
jgi:hypothetical protein